MKASGRTIASIDPLYEFGPGEIEDQFYKVVNNIIMQVRQTPDDWMWAYHRSPDHLRENRENALTKFIRDYPAREIRIFPLMTMVNKISPYLLPLVNELELLGYQTTIQKTE